MATFTYPTSAELTQIAAEKMPVLTLDDPIFQLFPIREVDEAIIIWDQMDMYGGLQAVRGLDGAPSRVKPVGSRRFMAEPGTYGEFMTLDELELTMRRQIGTWNTPVNISDLVIARQDQLLHRRVNRLRYIGWQLALNGTFAVARNNVVMHTDTYTIQTYTPTVDWSDPVNSTPVADLRAVALLSRGFGANFGAQSTLWLNQTEVNNLLNNRNPNDLGGLLNRVDAQPRSMDQINRILIAQGVAQIAVYDDGYFANDNGTGWTLWIPDGVGLLAGARPAGQRIGEYRMTRNVQNDNMAPGAYMKVIDRGGEAPGTQVPRTIEVHDGHNGGPVLFYPGSLIRMNI